MAEIIHPKPDDQGKPVLIRHPSTATNTSTWADGAQMAVFTPGSAVPPKQNGIAIVSLVPPAGAEGWEQLVKGNPHSDDPSLMQRPNKKRSAGAVIIEPDDRVWLYEPTNRFGGYIRTFPKRTQDEGYSLPATAAKETFEETGLLIAIGPRLVDVERDTSVCRYFLGRRIGGSPADMGWEAQAVCLVPLVMLSKMAPAMNDRPIIEAIMSGVRWR